MSSVKKPDSDLLYLRLNAALTQSGSIQQCATWTNLTSNVRAQIRILSFLKLAGTQPGCTALCWLTLFAKCPTPLQTDRLKDAAYVLQSSLPGNSNSVCKYISMYSDSEKAVITFLEQFITPQLSWHWLRVHETIFTCHRQWEQHRRLKIRYRLDGPGFEPGRGRKFSSQNPFWLSLEPTQPACSTDTGVYARRKSGLCVMLTFHLQLLPRLRMIGAIRLFPLYASTASTEPIYLLPSSHCAWLRMKQQFVATHQTGQVWQILDRPTCKHVMFLRHYRAKHFFCGYYVLTGSVFLVLRESQFDELLLHYIRISKGKDKVRPRRGHEGPEGE